MSGLEIAMGAGAALSAVGGVVGAAGAQSQGAAAAQAALFKGKAEANTDEYNASLDQYQANIDTRDRGIAQQQSLADAKDITTKNIAQMAQIRAAYGASGLSMEGSPLDVIESTAIEQSLDVEKTLYQGTVTEAGLTDRANMARAHASLLQTEAANALIGGSMGASMDQSAANYQSAASLISGVGGALRSFTPALPRA